MDVGGKNLGDVRCRALLSTFGAVVSVPASLFRVQRQVVALMRKAGLSSSLLHVGGSEQSELHVFIGVRGLLLTSVDHQGRSQSPQRTAWFW